MSPPLRWACAMPVPGRRCRAFPTPPSSALGRSSASRCSRSGWPVSAPEGGLAAGVLPGLIGGRRYRRTPDLPRRVCRSDGKRRAADRVRHRAGPVVVGLDGLLGAVPAADAGLHTHPGRGGSALGGRTAGTGAPEHDQLGRDTGVLGAGADFVLISALGRRELSGACGAGAA